jgi:hypothetical protein
MAQIYKIRTPDGNVVTPGDWTGAEPLFSVVEVPEGAVTILTAYSYGVGNSDVPGSIGPRRATEADTNLEGEGNRLPENEELIIFNIAVEVFAIGDGGDDAADLIPQSDPPEVSLLNMLRLQRDMLVTIRIASVNKRYIEAPIGYFPASTGVLNYTSGARSDISSGVEGYVSANNGSHNAHDIRELSSPLRVKGGETFGVDFIPGPGQIVGLNVDNANSGNPGRLRLRTFLDGYRRRPVA